MVLHTRTTAAERRRTFREQLASGRLLRMPGAINPLSARLIQDTGFDAVYLSGAVLAADLGLPDIGLTTSTEIAARAQQTTRVTDLPVLIDADTGFGEPMNAARTVQLLEDAGLAGLHLEDQVNPKRCGHLDNKVIIPLEDYVAKIRAAVAAKTNPNFTIIARTDSRAGMGLEEAVRRCNAALEAGAGMAFLEAPQSVEEIASAGISSIITRSDGMPERVETSIS